MCFRYMYFFEKGNPQITSSTIQSLIELIKTDLEGGTDTSLSSDPATNAFFASTLRYIQFQKQRAGALREKYDPIKL